MRTPLNTFLLAASLLVTGCGGGGGPDTVTVTLTATPSLSGFISATGGNFMKGGFMVVGDIVEPPEVGLRAFVSFDLGPIPTSANVLSATLRVRQSGVAGTSPYGALGVLVVDQVVYGPVLDVGAYSRSFPVNQAFVTLSTDATAEVKPADVTVAVQADHTLLRTQSQFRLRFTTETDLSGSGNQASLDGFSASATVVPPELIVTYQP